MRHFLGKVITHFTIWFELNCRSDWHDFVWVYWSTSSF